MDLLDTAWCPVCDRQIPPEVIVATPTASPPPTSPAPQPIKTRGGTIKAAPGSRRTAAGHLRPKSTANVAAAAQSPSPSPAPAAPASSSPPKKAAKPKTYISQAPTPLYCSPECELRDAMSTLSVSIPKSPTEATYAAYGRHAHVPSSPIMISGSSSSSDAGGSYGSPMSHNSDYFAYLEGRPRRPSQVNTGSSAESLSSLNQPSRMLPPTIAASSRSRRPSSSSLAPRSAAYAHSPPADGAKQYTLSFTRAPSSTASPSSSPPAISIMPAYAARRDRSLSRASSSLREAAGMALPLSPRSMPRSTSDMSTSTPRPFTPLESRPRPLSTSSKRKESPDGIKVLPVKEEEEPTSKWWSWNGYNVPTYEAMPVKSKDGTPERKRMFYFQQ